MSVKLLPRELGAVLTCNGCGARRHTGQIEKRLIRAWFKSAEGWGRGLVKPKRRDLCGEKCMPKEREAFEALKAKREKRRLERDERARAKQSEAA